MFSKNYFFNILKELFLHKIYGKFQQKTNIFYQIMINLPPSSKELDSTPLEH